MARLFVTYYDTKGLEQIAGIMNARLNKTIVQDIFNHFFLGEKFRKENASCHVLAETLTFVRKIVSM